MTTASENRTRIKFSIYLMENLMRLEGDHG